LYDQYDNQKRAAPSERASRGDVRPPAARHRSVKGYGSRGEQSLSGTITPDPPMLMSGSPGSYLSGESPHHSAPQQQQSLPRPLPSHSSKSIDSSPRYQQNHQTIRNKSAAKSKLPHGLTVSELKEMTKARLQAEAAAEKGSDGGLPPSAVSPAPPMFEYRDQAPEVVVGASPLPPALSHQPQRPRTHSQMSRDGWSQDGGGSRAEMWETGSVSTAASDYLGSESAYGGVGSYAGGEDPSPSPYGFRVAGSVPSGSAINSGGGPVSQFSDIPPPETVALPGVMSSSGYHLEGSAASGGDAVAPPGSRLLGRAARGSPRLLSSPPPRPR